MVFSALGNAGITNLIYIQLMAADELHPLGDKSSMKIVYQLR